MIEAILLFVGGFVTGILTLLGYMVSRCVGSDGWDDSNINNALRLLSHMVLHPEDFAKMFYLSPEALNLLIEARATQQVRFHRPFYYIDKDEFSENFPHSRSTLR